MFSSTFRRNQWPFSSPTIDYYLLKAAEITKVIKSGHDSSKMTKVREIMTRKTKKEKKKERGPALPKYIEVIMDIRDFTFIVFA